MSSSNAAQESPLSVSHNFQKHIAGLRAIAIALVMLSHFGVPGLFGGFIGVDIFFVISGFLITGLLVKQFEASSTDNGGVGSISLVGFYLRRVKRLLPASLTVSLAILLYTYFAFNSFRFATTLNDFGWAQAFSANLNFAFQESNYFLDGAGVSPFRHFWSLSVEEQFYFVWPIVLMATLALGFSRRSANLLSSRHRLIAVIAVISGFSFVAMIALDWVFPIGSYYLLASRAWELGFGALTSLALGLVSVKRFVAKIPGVFIDVALLTAIASVLLFSGSNGGAVLLLPVAASSVFIALGQSKSSFSTWLLSTALFQYVGKISYSLYLWHWPFWVFAIQANLLTNPTSWAWFILLLLATAAASYHLIERPFLNMKWRAENRWRVKLDKNSRTRLAIAAVAMVVAVVLLPTASVMPANRFMVDAVAQKFQSFAPGDDLSASASKPQPTNSFDGETKAQALTRLAAERTALVSASISESNTRAASPAETAHISDSIAATGWRDETGWSCKQIADYAQAHDCLIGDASASRSWLVIGDSQAAMYRGAFRNIVENNPQISVRLIFAEQCPNATTLAGLKPAQKLTDPSLNEGCLFTHKFINDAVTTGGFDFMLLTDASEYSASKYVDEASGWAKSLKQKVGSVAILTAFPKYQDLATCLNKDFSNLASCAGKPNADRTDFKVSEAAAVDLISASDLFCVKQVCPALVQGYPVVSHGHLDKNQAYLVGSILGQIIHAIAPRAF